MADKRETSRNQAQDPSISFTCSLDADSGGISNVSFEHDGVRYRAGTKGRMKLRVSILFRPSRAIDLLAL